MFLRPDGKFVYVLSYQTGELTIVDAETARVVNQLDVGNDARRMTVLSEGNTLAISDRFSVAFIDTKTNTKTGELKPSGEMTGPLLSPDGRYLVVLGKAAVFVLDPATGKQLRRIDGFMKPAQLVFSRVP